MPNFNCGGENCCRISCRDCTDGALCDKYWALMSAEPGLRDEDYERKAREWWANFSLRDELERDELVQAVGDPLERDAQGSRRSAADAESGAMARGCGMNADETLGRLWGLSDAEQSTELLRWFVNGDITAEVYCEVINLIESDDPIVGQRWIA